MSAKIDSALRDAKSALKAGASDRARDALIDVIMQFPKNSKALTLLTEVMRTRLGMAPRPFGGAHIQRIIQGKALMGPSVAAADAGALAALNAANAKAQGFHAALLVEAGHQDAARAQFEAALTLDPGQVEANINLANLFIRQEKHVLARHRLKTLVVKHPDNGPAWKLLGLACEHTFDVNGAVDALRRARDLLPDDAEVLYHLGTALSRTSALDEAVPLFEEIIKREPQNYQALNNLGNIRVSQGHMAEARALFERALKAHPRAGNAHYNLSRVISYKAGDPLIADMLELDKDTNLGTEERISLDFALAKALEGAKDDEGSFFHLKRGNDLRRTQLTYSTETRRAQFERIKSSFARATPAAHSTPIRQVPIFVLGMMRSGTSLTEQILSSHSRVTGAGELELMNELVGKHADNLNLTPDQLNEIRNEYLERLAILAPDADFVVDKMPANFRWIGLIRKAIPEARIIHLVRDPVAVCWSIYKNFFPAPEIGYAFDMQELAEYHDLYSDAMAHWRREYPGEFMDLDYEAMTQTPREVIGKMLEFCGLDWEEACLSPEDNKRAVLTASAKQVRSGIYTGSSKEWTRWEKYIQPLIAHFND